MIKSKITLLLICIVMFSGIIIGIVKVYNGMKTESLHNDEITDSIPNRKTDINIEVTNKPVVDIVLSTRQTDVVLDTFEDDVKKALVDLGVDISNFNFQTAETVSTVVDNNSASNIINTWTTFPYNADSNWFYTDGYITSDVNEAYETGFFDKNNGQISNISLNGTCYANEYSQPMGYVLRIAPQKNNINRYNGYFLWVSGFDGYNKNQNAGSAAASNISKYSSPKRVITLFKFEGLILDANIAENYRTGTTYSATPLCATMYSGSYRFGWPHHNPRNYGGYPDGTIMQNGVTVTNSGDSGLKTTTLGYAILDFKSTNGQDTFDLGITAKGNNFTVTYDGRTVFSVTDENAFKKGYYGLFEYSHVNPRFYNLNASFQKYKEYKDILREPNWRDDSYHIVVNVDDEIDDSLTGTDVIGEILSGTMNNDIHFIQWGTDKNKVSIEDFIAKNDNKGLFTQNNNYENAVDKTAEYIKSLIENKGNSQYVIVGEDTNILVSPEELKTGATSVDYPNGRWRIHHNYKYYANDLGQSVSTEVYTPDLMCNFDKPGEYEIYFDDELVKKIYAHRRPVADFTIGIREGEVELNSKSIDLDSEEDIGYGKGIEKEKWYYKKATEVNWTEGKLTRYNGNDIYVIKLEVTDKQGETSYTTKYIGVGNPVASFNYKSNRITKYQELEINDTSYDPGGKEIVKWSWTLKKEGVIVGTYTEKEPTVIKFNSEELGVGNYTYELVVTNNEGKESEAYKKGFTVIEDTDAPEVIINPTNSEWEKYVNVRVEFKDTDSGYNSFRYAIDEKQEITNETKWSEYLEEEIYRIEIKEEGMKYLHIEASDKAGNILKRTVGIYKIDSTEPEGVYEIEQPTEEKRAAVIVIEGEDELSGVEKIILPDGKEVEGDRATYEIVEPGEYRVIIVDRARNEKELVIQAVIKSEGVEVKYINEVTGEEIAKREKIEGNVGEEYKTEQKEIEGYVIVKIPENTMGEMTIEKKEVEYEYRKQSKVITRYIDENTGEEIIERKERIYTEGEEYREYAREIVGYRLIEEAENKEGVVRGENIEIVHKYKKESGGVRVKYIDKITGIEILPSIEIQGLEKDIYETELKEIKGYEIERVPENAEGEMKVEITEVVYEYRKVSKVITKYIDANTKEEIIERKEELYKEGERYRTIAEEKEEYVMVKEAENKEGIVGRKDIEVVYEYKKVSEGLVVKYIDYVTNEIIEEKVYEGKEKDKIKIEIKEYEEYVEYIKPKNEEITLTEKLQEVKVYYRKKIKIEIIGIEEETGEEIYREEKEGIEGDVYETKAKEIEGYIVSEEPDNKKGVYIRNRKEVIYKYRRSSEGVKVEYIDRETGEKLGEEKIEGLEGQIYKVEIKEFEKYEYKGAEGEIKGEFKRELIEVKCYYEKKRGKIEIIYEDEEGKEIYKEEKEGKVDDKYKIEERKIKNYRIKVRPEEIEGEYKEEKIIIKYIVERIIGKVIINIVDEKGNIIEVIEKEGKAGEEEEIELPEIEGYKKEGEKKIKVEYKEEEVRIEVRYKKEEIKEPSKPNEENKEEIENPPFELPDTSDINIFVYIIIFVSSTLIFVIVLLRNKKKK